MRNEEQDISEFNKYLIGVKDRTYALIINSILTHRCELVPISDELVCTLLLVLCNKSLNGVEK